MKKCCGSIDLTLGVKIIGILYTIYSIIGIIICYVGISDVPAFLDYINSIRPDLLENKTGLSDYLQLNPILSLLRILIDTNFLLLCFLINGFLAYIASFACSVCLVVEVEMKDLVHWLSFEFGDVSIKILFMIYFGIPLLIIPIAFDIYSIICVLSLIKQLEGEIDPEDQVDEDDDDCSVLICCF